MKRNREMYDFTLTAIFGAIIMVLSLVPFLGYIQIGVVGVTIIHVAALIGIALVRRKYAIIIGFIFGLGSWIVAMTRPASPFDFAFQFPWISILPRMLFAYLAHLVFTNLKRISFKERGNAIMVSIVSAVIVVTLFLVTRYLIQSFTLNIFISYVVAGIISIGLIVLYYLYTKNKISSGYIISSLAISTIIHTVVVLLSLAFLVPSDFYADFLNANNTTILNVIFTIAISNGAMEVLIAILIGTPIIVALKSLQEVDDK